MAVLTASLAVLAFLAACSALRLVSVARTATATASGALAIMRDPALDDDAKEQAARRAALGLFGGFFSILLRSAVAVLASLVVIYLVALTGLVTVDAVMATLQSLRFIIGASVAVTVLFVLAARKYPGIALR